MGELFDCFEVLFDEGLFLLDARFLHLADGLQSLRFPLPLLIPFFFTVDGFPELHDLVGELPDFFVLLLVVVLPFQVLVQELDVFLLEVGGLEGLFLEFVAEGGEVFGGGEGGWEGGEGGEFLFELGDLVEMPDPLLFDFIAELLHLQVPLFVLLGLSGGCLHFVEDLREHLDLFEVFGVGLLLGVVQQLVLSLFLGEFQLQFLDLF